MFYVTGGITGSLDRRDTKVIREVSNKFTISLGIPFDFDITKFATSLGTLYPLRLL